MPEEAKEQSLANSFLGVQKVLESKLNLAQVSNTHAPTHGDIAENHWIDLFRAYLPKRYEVSTGFIIDSLGKQSDQIDIIIFDKQYSPTLLDQNGIQYVPAEAVYAVFEAKPHIDKGYLEYAGEKAASVRKLKRTSIPIVHAGGEYPAKPLFPVVAGIVAKKADWSDGLGKSFLDNLPKGEDAFLDCGCALQDGSFDHNDGEINILNPLAALIYFMFRLLSKLQSLGTVPAIDWGAYANVLDTKMPYRVRAII